jgi:hypothetical protein
MSQVGMLSSSIHVKKIPNVSMSPPSLPFGSQYCLSQLLTKLDFNVMGTNTFALEVDSEIHNSILASHFDFVIKLVKDFPQRVSVGWKRLDVDVACPLDLAQLLYS